MPVLLTPYSSLLTPYIYPARSGGETGRRMGLKSLTVTTVTVSY
jgi:hypothetical protein